MRLLRLIDCAAEPAAKPSLEPLGDATVVTARSATMLAKAIRAIATTGARADRRRVRVNRAMHTMPARIDVRVSSTYDRYPRTSCGGWAT